MNDLIKEMTRQGRSLVESVQEIQETPCTCVTRIQQGPGVVDRKNGLSYKLCTSGQSESQKKNKEIKTKSRRFSGQRFILSIILYFILNITLLQCT